MILSLSFELVLDSHHLLATGPLHSALSPYFALVPDIISAHPLIGVSNGLKPTSFT